MERLLQFGSLRSSTRATGQPTLNQRVLGSSPSAPTNKIKDLGPIAELTENRGTTPGTTIRETRLAKLTSRGQPCGRSPIGCPAEPQDVPARRAVFGEHENRQLQTSADPAPKVAGSSPVAPAINAVRRISIGS